MPTLKRGRFECLQAVRVVFNERQQRVGCLDIFDEKEVCPGLSHVLADALHQSALHFGVVAADQSVAGQSIATQIPGWSEFLFASDSLGNQNGCADGFALFQASDQFWGMMFGVARETQLGQEKVGVLSDSTVPVVLEDGAPCPVVSGEMLVE